LSNWLLALNLVFSLGFFVVFYKFLPLYLTTEAKGYFPRIENPFLFNLLDGVIRIALFLGFLWLISQWKDIQRVFEYHGAEHKVVFNFESGQDVNVANAQRFTTLHPRCGTSFLLVVMMVSIVVYTIVPAEGFLQKFLSRIVLLPIITGLSYEMIRYAAKKRGSLLAMLTAPGLWLQKITTQPPDDGQTAVAIHALEGAMKLEAQQGGEMVIA
jgi:uncharacterized protein YqhQ